MNVGTVLSDGEKEWYLQGYKLGSKSSYEKEAWLICGSGVIVYRETWYRTQVNKIASNKTAEGRATNRRVELKISN